MWNYYTGLFLKSFATLLLELSLVRVISISKWSHYAYLVVSMALLGFGASGTFLSLCSHDKQKTWSQNLGFLNVFMALAILISFYWANRIPLDPAQVAWDSWQIVYLIYYYLVLSIPFFFSGMVSSLVFRIHPEKAHELYFADLSGAALGCLGAVYLLSLVPSNWIIVVSSLICILAGWFFSHRKMLVKISLVLLMILEFLIIFRADKFDILNIYMSPFKALPQALRFPHAEILATRWNAYSRVDVFKSPAVHVAPGLSLTYQETLPAQLGLTIDGDNLSAITRGENLAAKASFLSFLPSSLVYRIRPGASVMIINAGGGLNILEALYHRASQIDAIEPNSAIISLLQGAFKEFSGHVCGAQKVTCYNEEIRSYLARTDKKYDVIQMSLSTNPSAASTGLYSLNEDYRFTVEAFQEYIKHLNNDGIFTLTRYLLPPPREDVRFIALAKRAMELMASGNYDRNIFVFRSWGTITLLLKKQPFSLEEIETLKKAIHTLRFDPVYYPGMPREEANKFNRFKEPVYYQITQKILFHSPEIAQEYPYDLTPVYDDNPYYFHFFKWKKIPELYKLMNKRWQAFLEGGYLIIFMLGQATLAASFIIILPLTWRYGLAFRSVPGKWTYVVYFSSLGLAFMLVELSLIQKFILVLEHPIIAFSLILFSLLISSGLGSLFSGRDWVQKKFFTGLIGKSSFNSLVFLLILVFILLFYSYLLSFLSMAISGKSLAVRKLISVIVIFPLGFLMGIPFPSGLKWIGTRFPEIIPWAWAINGSNSVVGSLLASQLALSLGFSGVLKIAALLYATALAAFIKMNLMSSEKQGRKV